ncbi:conserved protein of unknown function [Pseudodesulfovibrio profundus]|uniref:Uncharacterized protein n=1 Tax=Pseudodesulfovibrio profundus TaxID=57320 RepID=A0A2C8FEW1_9BACT|nr:hypothetical protein [Pseudodesulfovibrio profundus]MBC16979.1 hypothetical protein [Desulfovibrio sp.]SOB60438.1 conserved protein of unknown function [Pseudodesulfovibrio profundus]|tara:strand:- start:7989 stop:8261 length:273 start_codon:yes stop_codon:yes gene_type:complete
MPIDIYEDTVYGQILPSEWDNERVSSLILLVDGDEEFIIEKNDQADTLVNHIDRWITAEGVITETNKSIRIKVRNFKLEDDIDYEEDDDW